MTTITLNYDTSQVEFYLSDLTWFDIKLDSFDKIESLLEEVLNVVSPKGVLFQTYIGGRLNTVGEWL